MFNEIKSLYLEKLILFLFLLFFSSVIIAQTSNWTNVKETNINVANANPAGVDIFTNRYGNHIIVQESNILKYYKMNVNGIAGSPVTIENSAVVSPSISGDADNIYIVYGIGNQVRVKRSTNGGSTWSLWTPIFSLSTNVAELGLESVVSSGKIHVTYLESGVVRYIYRNLSGGGWSPVKEVSNGETGNTPRITAYKNAQVQMDYVYFMYRKFNGVDYDCRWRRYNITNDSWHTPIYTAPIALNPSDVTDGFLGFRADNQNVVIYFRFHTPQPWQYYFAWVNLDLYNNRIGYGYADLSIENYRMYSTPTADGKTHTVHYWEHLVEGYSPIGLWRSYIADTHPSDQFYEYELPQINAVKHLNISSAGNEVHVI